MKAFKSIFPSGVLSILVLSLMLSARAQSAVVVEGTITDSVTGTVLEGASVFVGISEGSGKSDASGRYSISLEEAGSFDLRVFKSGYEFLVVEKIDFADGKTVEQNFELTTVGGMGPLTRSAEEVLDEIPEGVGSVEGRITETVRSRPLTGVTVVLESADETVPDQETVTERGGQYAFTELPAGYYTLRFAYEGHQPATLSDVAIRPDEVTTWDWGLTEIPAQADGDVFIMDAFEVSAEVLTQREFDFKVLRKDAVNMVDLFSASDFAKFAASDVGEAIQRIPGVTVEGGKFAVIRGLNERYSSTLLNGAPVPSPDPDRQSVPLDLFPSEIVSNLVVSKTFSPYHPGNSAAGSLDILTNTFPEEFTVKFAVGTGTNSEAQKQYITGEDRRVLKVNFSDLGNNDTVALEAIQNEQIAPLFDDVPMDVDYKLEVGGKHTFDDGRNFRYFATFLQEWSYDSNIGIENEFFAAAPQTFIVIPADPPITFIAGSGDYAEGALSITRGTYDFIESTAEKTTSGLATFEFDLFSGGKHKLNYTGFYIDVELDRATYRDNGQYIGADEAALLNQDPEQVLIQLAGGFDEFSTMRFWETNLVNETRVLRTHQVGGSHEFGDGSPLKVRWIGSESSTSQKENHSISGSGWELPGELFQTGNNTDISSDFLPTASWRSTDEDQSFRRIDADYTLFWYDFEIKPLIGISREETSRDIAQEFVRYTRSSDPIDTDTILTGYATIDEAIRNRYSKIETNTPGAVDVLSEREVVGKYFSLSIKASDKFEIVPGFRLEDFEMTTSNGLGDGDFFNSEFLQNSSRFGRLIKAEQNAAILGYDAPLEPGFVGRIDENLYLPSLNVNYQYSESLRVLFAYSKTFARPSFKEFTYITTRDPVTLDYTTGNPNLTISPVQSYDLRLEFVKPGSGDLAAVSVFHKSVRDPIEKVTLFGSVQTDTFFNNPNTADIKGIEFELRKGLGFINEDSFWQYLSVGGNFTYMDAEVGVPETFRSLLAEGLTYTNVSGSDVKVGGGFFATDGGTTDLLDGDIGEAPTSRPLFDQPEWIVNADITFDHPEWGTRATLSLFAQSEVLDAAGGFLIGVSPTSAIPDRYRMAFHSLDFSLRQNFKENYYVSFSVRNITNSTRGVVYDEDLIGGSIKHREYKVGRDYSVSLGAEF